MQKEKTIEQQIIEAIEDVKQAMLENLTAGKLEVEAKANKERTHYKLIKAKERLNGLERSI